ncbi:MAG: phosphoribosylaminoimidazolesuccinocarboxamide synthase [Vulcanimicrobiota bacterium]
MLSNKISQATPVAGVDLDGFGPKQSGKVRDAYLLDGRRILITTDRVSAFDRVVGLIPFKGQVLNRLTNWWFEKTKDLVSNHLLESPHPNVAVVRDAEPLPVEVIVRGYITGVTGTSLWTLYHKGVDKPYGLDLPAGLKKNDKLPENVITPTTKGGPGQKDERLTCAEVVERGLVSAELWAEVERVALELFRRGQEVAEKAGLILVDTKYEFGLIDGKLSLIDEVHTPDSSRYWLAGTQADPVYRDKELLRLWLAEVGFTGEGESPPIPQEKANEMAQVYCELFEQLTGETIEVPGKSIEEAMLGLKSGVA